MNLSDVFNESKIPAATFVEPREFAGVVGSLSTAGKHVTVMGPSGSGKTTLVLKAFERLGIQPSDLLVVNGRRFRHATGVLPLFAEYLDCDSGFDSVTDYLKMVRFVVIDDFHHLPFAVRLDLASQLKLWHEEGVRFVLIGIASSATELLGEDPEIAIRNDPHEMGTQDEAFCASVFRLGGDALNASFRTDEVQKTAQASRGIPSVIQAIARVACEQAGVTETQEEQLQVEIDLPQVRARVLANYHPRYRDKTIGLASGKRQARSVQNTYLDIVEAIARDERSEIPVASLREEIVLTIQDEKQRSRKSSSFYNCLRYLKEVIDEQDLSGVISYNDRASTIVIEDPAYRFYLSLVDIKEIRASIHVREEQYDVALSFAGEHRAYVEACKTAMENEGLAVFYDFDQQAILWGQDLRPLLAEVYANRCRYMVVFVSQEYPEKDWPAFEFEIGKEAAAKKTSTHLLPVLLDDTKLVGLKGTIGRLDGRTTSPEATAKSIIQRMDAGDQDGVTTL